MPLVGPEHCIGTNSEVNLSVLSEVVQDCALKLFGILQNKESGWSSHST